MNIIKKNGAFSILIFVFVAVIEFSNIGIDKVEAGAPADPPKNDSCKCAVYVEDQNDGCMLKDQGCDGFEHVEKGDVHKGKSYTKNIVQKYILKRTFSAWRNDCIKPGPKMKPLVDEGKKLEAKSSGTNKEKKRSEEIKKEIENGIKNGKMHCDKWSGTCLQCKLETIGGGEDPFPFILITGPLKKLSKATGS